MEHFILFVLISFPLVMLPGPDTALATANTLTSGRSGGLSTICGTCTALCIHTTAAALGLSALFVKSAVLFTLFKYAGAAYLAYLGIKALWSQRYKKQPLPPSKSLGKQKLSAKSCYCQGLLTDLLNPKVAVFFLTFLPQFIRPDNSSILPFFLLGFTHVLVNAAWFLLYVLLIDSIRTFMQKPSVQRIIQGITGLALIGFSIKLALEKQR